jgi:hypothetical protein
MVREVRLASPREIIYYPDGKALLHQQIHHVAADKSCTTSDYCDRV